MDQLINAIGSMAEMTALFYKTLTEKGLTEDAAVQISCAFVSQLVASASPASNE